MRVRWCGAVAGMVLAMVLPAAAQQRQASLEELLTKVQANYAEYLRTLPNLYAQESMLSNVTFIMPPLIDPARSWENQHVAYDSIYRLRRVSGAADDREMEETRQIVAVDHKLVAQDLKLAAPYLVIDSEYAPNVFWPGWGPCFDYKQGANRQWQGKTVWVLEYATGKGSGLRDKCPLQEPVSGLALIDPETMTMVRFEQTRSRHSPEMSTIKKLGVPPESFGVWRWSIDYAPVTLEGKSFRLPKTITSTFELFNHPHVLWSSVANYTHYQLADVHSKVMLPDGTPVEKQ